MKEHVRLPHCSGTRALIIAWLGAWLIPGCAGLTRIQPTESSGTPPILVGAKGELTPEQSKAILQAVDHHSSSDLLEKHLSAEEAIADLPLVVGNRVTLLQDGPATYQAMYAAIRAARDNINLEIYLQEDDEMGRQLADLLLTEQRRGCRSISFTTARVRPTRPRASSSALRIRAPTCCSSISSIRSRLERSGTSTTETIASCSSSTAA